MSIYGKRFALPVLAMCAVRIGYLIGNPDGREIWFALIVASIVAVSWAIFDTTHR
jgi:hypothetical protein